MLAISLFSSSVSAALVRIDFYTEMTRTFTVDEVELFDRTSATGVIFYDDATGIYPAGNPVINLKNERFVDGVDSTDSLLVIDPSLAPQDWIVGLDDVGVSSSGGVVTNFSIDVFRIGNSDPGDFNNPAFKNFVDSSRILAEIDIPSADFGAIWTNTSGLPPITTTVNWSYTVVPVPAAVWLFSSGLLGLIGIARRKKTA